MFERSSGWRHTGYWAHAGHVRSSAACASPPPPPGIFLLVRFGPQLPQTSAPHERQWCRRRVKVKATPHTVHVVDALSGTQCTICAAGGGARGASALELPAGSCSESNA